MSAALSAFQPLFHEYYTCYVFSADGMVRLLTTLPIDLEKYPDQKLRIGHSAPYEEPPQAVMNASKLVASAKKDGEFPDILAKSLLVRIYADWDERYRHEIAAEMNAKPENVRSDLMGDLRHVRNWIVHGKSIVQAGVSKIKVLQWGMTEGEELRITSVRFREFADRINSMEVRIETSSGAGATKPSSQP